jgi:hypothetical protein
MYRQQRETIMNMEHNIERRRQQVQEIDERIKLIEDIKSGKAVQQEPPPENIESAE